jgi:hypothetical protein
MVYNKNACTSTQAGRGTLSLHQISLVSLTLTISEPENFFIPLSFESQVKTQPLVAKSCFQAITCGNISPWKEFADGNQTA